MEKTTQSEKKAASNANFFLHRATEKGRIDISSLSKEEQRRVYRLFQERPQHFSSHDQVEFLEQCIGYGVIDDATALSHIQTFNDEQKQTIGMYLAYLRRPNYCQSLWACWDYIPYDVMSELRTYCVREKPELVMLVAPFVDLTKLYVIEKENGSKTIIHRSFSSTTKHYRFPQQGEKEYHFLGHFFETYEGAQQLISTLIAYAKNAKTELHADSPVIKNLQEVYRPYLFPYFHELKDLGENLFQHDFFDGFFRFDDQYLDRNEMPACDPIKFLTNQELYEFSQFKKEIIRHNPKHAERLGEQHPETFVDTCIDDSLPPEKARRALMQIMDAGRLRATQTILASFKKSTPSLTEEARYTFLLKCLDSGYPVFSALDLLGFPKEEIIELFKKTSRLEDRYPLMQLSSPTDTQMLLAYNRQHPDGEDLEDLIVKNIIKDITDYEAYSGLGNFIHHHADEFFSSFREESRKKIFAAIREISPNLWTHNIPYALEEKIFAFHELLNVMPPLEFLRRYNEIIHTAKKLERNGEESGVTVEDIRAYAKEIIQRNPAHFFQYPQIIQENFATQEIDSFIVSRLTIPVHPKFFFALLASDYRQPHQEHCKRIALDDPFLIQAAFELHADRDFLIELIGKDAIIRKVAESRSIEFDELFNNEFAPRLISSEKLIDLLFKNIEEARRFNSYAELLNIIQRILKDRSVREEYRYWKAADTIPEERLKKLGGEIIRRLKIACEKDSFLIFEKFISAIPELDPAERMRSSIDAYSARHPEKLLEQTSSGTFMYQDVVGEEKFKQLVAHFSYRLAFSNDDLASLLSEPLKQILQDINPILRIQWQERLDGDFFLACIEIVKHSPFFPLYETELRRIAIQEYELYGVQKNTKDVIVPKEFRSILARIAILDTWHFSKEQIDVLLGLPGRKRESLFRMFEIIAIHTPGEHHLNPSICSVDAINHELTKRVEPLFEGFFDVTPSEKEIKNFFGHMNGEGCQALIIYQQKSDKKNRELQKAFQELLSSFFAGTYHNWRAWGGVATNEQEWTARFESLKKDGFLPEKLAMNQYMQWLEEDTVDVEKVLNYDIASIHASIKEVIEQAAADSHINKGILSQTPHQLEQRYVAMIQPLHELTLRQKEIQTMMKPPQGQPSQELTRMYQETKEAIADFMEENRNELNQIKALRYLHALTTISSSDLEQKILTIDKSRVPLKEVFKTIQAAFKEDYQNFVHDSNRIQMILEQGHRELFKGARASKSKLSITDRIDPNVYVRIGEAPVPSCQHYDGGSMNEGLLAYLTDPHVKIIQIYDEQENIIARAAMRLLSDSDGNPVLFAERVYSVNAHPKIKEAVQEYVARKAENLGVAWATWETGMLINGPLFSRNTKSSAIYSDAGGGLMERGVFTIESGIDIRHRFKCPQEKNN